MTKTTLYIECLGGLRLGFGKKALALSAKARVLLCYLAISARPHSREALAGLLWSELAEEAARANLRTMLPKLRAALGPYLEIGRDTIAFNRASPYRLDVELFLGCLTSLDGEADANRLREAANLYRGDFLDGVRLDGMPLFEEWALGQRERLKGLAVGALHVLAAHHTERAEYAAAGDYLGRLLALEPWREDSHRQRMTMLALSGQQDAALAQYRKCRQVLAEELGAEPARETTELYERIKAGEVETRPPAKSRHTLPLLPTALLGRHEELARVAELLANCRLLTLTGPGGVGKTSLALGAAREALELFPGGVFFIPLAAVSDPEMVVPAIAQALGVQEATGRPLVENINASLQDEGALLVLDNFEHLLSAAPVVADLLAHCPTLKVMTTSRAALELRGERELELPPLAVPDLAGPLYPEALLAYPAVALFSERAQAVKPDFALTEENAAAVATICVRLDGLPLALELAAARVKVMSPGTLLARLGERLKLLTGGARDLPPRQRTLRSTIAWSYELLEPDMQGLFARLAVFTGGFSLEAAEAVCAEAGLDALEGVALLANQSLLRREDGGEGRFRMLETIREYALERLEASGEAETLRYRHAAFFRDLSERAEEAMKGAEQVAWLSRLESEGDNLRAALAWAAGRGEMETGLRLAGALAWFWFMRGRFGEGREWLEGLLTGGSDVAPGLRAKALYGAGMLARRQGDGEAAAARLEEGLELFRQLGDTRGMAASLHHLAHVAEARGDYPKATALFKESLALAREAGDAWELTLTLTCLAHAAHEHGDDGWAAALLGESLPLCRELGNPYGTCDALRILGLVALASGDAGGATARLEESLALARELGNKQGMALLFPALARSALRGGDVPRAKALLRQGLALRSEGGKLGLVQCLRGLAEAAAAEGDLAEAARFLGAAQALQETSGEAANHRYLEGHERLLAKTRAALGDDIFAAAWAEGRALRLEAAVAYALETS